MLSSPQSSSSDTPAQQDLQIVAVQLAGEIYGIDITKIHTVIMPQAITPVPRAPEFVLGVINLRGRVAPVIDLRTRFGLPPLGDEHSRQSRLVIVEANGETTGMIVDAVLEVLTLPAGCIEPPARLVIAPEMAECITGIGRIPAGPDGAKAKRESGGASSKASGERLIVLLDIVKMLAATPDESLCQQAA